MRRSNVAALDRGLGTRRARAATLLMLALPGSAYLYQGEELGLHEVADIPNDRREDPAFLRSGGAEQRLDLRDGLLFVLPLGWVPFAVAAGLLLGSSLEYVTGRTPQPCAIAKSAGSTPRRMRTTPTSRHARRSARALAPGPFLKGP